MACSPTHMDWPRAVSNFHMLKRAASDFNLTLVLNCNIVPICFQMSFFQTTTPFQVLQKHHSLHPIFWCMFYSCFSCKPSSSPSILVTCRLMNRWMFDAYGGYDHVIIYDYNFVGFYFLFDNKRRLGIIVNVSRGLLPHPPCSSCLILARVAAHHESLDILGRMGALIIREHEHKYFTQKQRPATPFSLPNILIFVSYLFFVQTIFC